MAIGNGGPKNEVRPLHRFELSAVAVVRKSLGQPVLDPPVQHLEGLFESSYWTPSRLGSCSDMASAMWVGLWDLISPP